jgi:hypothetical protein
MKMKMLKWSLYCFCMLGVQTAILAQAPVKKALTAEELKQWDSEPVAENPLAKLSAQEKARARDQAQAMLTYVVKAVLYRSDPSKYPLDENENSPQSVALTSLKNVSAYTFNKMKDKTTTLLSDPAKRSLLLGKFKDVDFRKKSIHADVKKIIPLDKRPAMMVKDRDEAAIPVNPRNIATGIGGSVTPEDKTFNFNKMDLVLRRVRCMDETNPETPGDDDMIVGGLIIGASGNVAKARSIVSCHFDDGDVCEHGLIPFGTYNLNSTSDYPKTFYAILQLIEVDTDEADAAHALSEIMGIAAAALAGTGYGAALAAVAAAIEVFAGWLFDDDAFHPYGVALNLSNSNVFGADGKSNYWVTGGISDHGGTYKLGFYWQLKN